MDEFKVLEGLSDAQLANLTNEEISALIDKHCALAGVPLPMEPKFVGAELPQPDVTVFCLDSVCFSKEEDATEIARLASLRPRVGKRYHYGKGYEQVVDQPPDVSVKAERMWSPARLEEVGESLDYAATVKKNQEECGKRYKADLERWSEAGKPIRNAIIAARERVNVVAGLNERFARYLKVADGDREKAIEFMKLAEAIPSYWTPADAEETNG